MNIFAGFNKGDCIESGSCEILSGSSLAGSPSSEIGEDSKKIFETAHSENQENTSNFKRTKIDNESNSNFRRQPIRRACKTKHQERQLDSNDFEDNAVLKASEKATKSTKLPVKKKNQRVHQQRSSPRIPPIEEDAKKSSGIRYDKKIIKQACQRLREGASVKSVAQELDVKREVVSGWRAYYIRIPMAERKKWNKKKYEQEKVLEACKLMKEGATTKFLAERYGLDKRLISSWRSRYAPETLKETRKIRHGESTILEACRELKEGGTVSSVAATMGIGYYTIQAWQRKCLIAKFQELTPEGTWEYIKYTKLEACNRLKQGETLEDVAEDLDIPRHILHKWKSENIVTITAQPKDGYKYDKQYILNVCNRLQQGETGLGIAKSLGIDCVTVYRWKSLYCRSQQPQPSDGPKHNKSTVLQACNLLKSGERAKDVAQKLKVNLSTVKSWKYKYLNEETPKTTPKYHSVSTVLSRARNSKCKESLLVAYKLLKQGHRLTSVARKLKVDIKTVWEWKRHYFLITEASRDSSNYDKKVIQQVHKSFKHGASTAIISKKFDIGGNTVNEWRCKYLEGVTSKFLESMNIDGNSSDVKLMSLPVVILSRDPTIDKLGQMRFVQPHFKTGRHVNRKIIQQGCKRLKEEGTSMKTVAKDLDGVRERRVARWRIQRVPKEERIQKHQYHEGGNKFCKLTIKGATTSFLAERYGVNKGTIAYWRHKYAPQTYLEDTRKSKYSERVKLQVCRELKKGTSQRSIALKMGIGRPSIKRWQVKYLTRRFEETSSKGSWEYNRYTKLEALLQIKQDVALETIAKELSLDINLVRKWKIDCAKTGQRRSNRLNSPKSEDHSFECKGKKVTRAFIPLRKVFIPRLVKLRFIKMIDEGVSIGKLSEELNVNELTLESWILNKDLLTKSNAANERKLSIL